MLKFELSGAGEGGGGRKRGGGLVCAAPEFGLHVVYVEIELLLEAFITKLKAKYRTGLDYTKHCNPLAFLLQNFVVPALPSKPNCNDGTSLRSSWRSVLQAPGGA